MLIGKPWRVGFDATAYSAQRGLIELTAASDRMLVLTNGRFGNQNLETSTQEGLQWQRKSAAGTGTTATPVLHQPNMGAVGFTARHNLTAEGTVTVTWPSEPFNLVGDGWIWAPIPKGFIYVPPSGIIALRWAQAPEGAVDIAGFLEGIEIG